MACLHICACMVCHIKMLTLKPCFPQTLYNPETPCGRGAAVLRRAAGAGVPFGAPV